MSSHFLSAREGRAAASVVCVAAALVMTAPAARAQGLLGFFDQSPARIARGLESAGYQLRGPLMRRGDVYIADVDGGGYRFRMVLDARTGEVLQRYPVRDLLDERPRWRERNLAEGFDAPPQRGLEPDVARPAPDSTDDDAATPPRRRPALPQVARGESPSTPPVVIEGVGPTPENSDSIEHPKPKPRVVKRKIAPVAAIAPTASEPAPPAQAPNPALRPVAAPAKATAAVAPSAAPAVESPRIQSAKPAAAAPKPVVEAEPAPKPTPKPKAVNDLPENTLD